MPPTSEPLRVLHVVTTMNVGGLETFLMNMYRSVDRTKVQFDFLCHRPGPFAFSEEISGLGGHIWSVPRANPLDPRYLRVLDRFFAGHPYRVVHSHIDCMSAFPLAAAKRHGTTTRIAHSHNSSQDKDLKYPIKLASKRLIPQVATDLFACSEAAGRWMFGGDDFEVVRNGIDTEAFRFSGEARRRVREELGIPEDALVVGHVGRFDPAKNHERVLHAFCNLHELRADARLLLVGDGDLRPRMGRLADDLALADAVSFLGRRGDVPALMSAMDVLLFPSRYEGLPLTLVEAQASGLPCLASDGVPEDADAAGGHVSRLALAETDEAWADALLSLVNGHSYRASAADAVRAAGFDASTEARRLQGIYLSRTEERFQADRVL